MLRENVLLVPFLFLNMLLYLGCAATLALGFFVRPSARGVSEPLLTASVGAFTKVSVP
jgi:hypothetical protein